jgi:hypothetical protein
MPPATLSMTAAGSNASAAMAPPAKPALQHSAATFVCKGKARPVSTRRGNTVRQLPLIPLVLPTLPSLVGFVT